jgi:hypothetical protein
MENSQAPTVSGILERKHGRKGSRLSKTAPTIMKNPMPSVGKDDRELVDVAPERVLSEEEVCASRQYPMFPNSWETVETTIGARYLLARARMRNVFVGPIEWQSLLVDVPKLGRCIVWRTWHESLQVVRIFPKGGRVIEFEKGNLLTLTPEVSAQCTFVFDQTLNDIPPWNHH